MQTLKWDTATAFDFALRFLWLGFSVMPPRGTYCEQQLLVVIVLSVCCLLIGCSCPTASRWRWVERGSEPQRPSSNLTSSMWREWAWPSCSSTPSRRLISTSGQGSLLSCSCLAQRLCPSRDGSARDELVVVCSKQRRLLQTHRPVRREHHVPRPAIQTGERDQAALPGEGPWWRHQETISRSFQLTLYLLILEENHY